MAAKCEIFVNCIQTNMKSKQGILRECERTNMASNVKYLRLSTLHGHYTCVYNFQSYWYKYRKQNMSAKLGICKCSLVMKNKNGCHMHSTYTYSR